MLVVYNQNYPKSRISAKKQMNSLRRTINTFNKQPSHLFLCTKRTYVTEKKHKLSHDVTNIRDENRELREDNDNEILRQKEIRYRGKDDRGSMPEKAKDKDANPFTTIGGNPDPDKEAELHRMLKGEPQQGNK